MPAGTTRRCLAYVSQKLLMRRGFLTLIALIVPVFPSEVFTVTRVTTKK